MTSNQLGLELRADQLRLALRPDLGGAIAGLWLGDAAVMRSMEPWSLQSSRQSGCFPLAPYSNRVGYRRFAWQGHDYTTAANFDDNPHSVHGTAWQEPWDVAHADASSITLRLDHVADAHWPFAYAATQTFELNSGWLRLSMTMTNTDTRNQPAGLGWHPYFPKRSRSRVHVECSGRWETDPATQLPTAHVAQHGVDSDVRYLNFDHCFDGWRGAARIRDEVMSLSINSSMTRLVIFTPEDRNYFCVEPVSHASDAIHMADPEANGLVALAPGASTQAWMQLDVARA